MMCGRLTGVHGTLQSALFALTIGAVVALGIGCRRNDGSTPKSAGANVTVRIAYFPNVTHMAAIIGSSQGKFQHAFGPRVHVEERLFAAGPLEIEAVFADQVDIGYIGPGPAINGFEKSRGKALRIIAGASSGGAALVIRSDAGISGFKDLASKRIAVPQTGGTQDISMRHALQTVGLSSTDRGGNVSIVPVTPADTLTLFVKKELDAAWVTEPWVSRLIKEGGGALLKDERDLWHGGKFASSVVIVRTQFLEEHPDLVAAFLRAHVETVDWILGHRKEAVPLVSARLKELTGKALPADVLATAMQRTDPTYDPLPETIFTFAEWSKLLGYQRSDRSALNGIMEFRQLNGILRANHKAEIH